MHELRCEFKKFGELYPEDDILEIKCSSSFCGARPGVIVIHGFDIRTGKLVGTERFKDPGANTTRKEKGLHAA
jgi:hypothetical protein